MRELSVAQESWPIRGTFAISRGSKTSAEVVTVSLQQDGHTGRGECVPYARYGESIDSVISAIESVRRELQAGADRAALQQLLPAGAARNAIDCALWDHEAKAAGVRVWQLAGLAEPVAQVTAYTLSLATAQVMHQSALDHCERPLLKLKLAGDGDIERVAAVREGAPNAQIIVDANEGWNIEQYQQMVPELARLGVAMIEQPLPAGQDAGLAGVDRPIPLCADESCHDAKTLADLQGRYDVVNIKLDKTGGLTEALLMRDTAQQMGFDIMVGCMIATSLAMAPATIIGTGARVVDLDGPLLLAADRENGLDYGAFKVSAPDAALWG